MDFVILKVSSPSLSLSLFLSLSLSFFLSFLLFAVRGEFPEARARAANMLISATPTRFTRINLNRFSRYRIVTDRICLPLSVVKSFDSSIRRWFASRDRDRDGPCCFQAVEATFPREERHIAYPPSIRRAERALSSSAYRAPRETSRALSAHAGTHKRIARTRTSDCSFVLWLATRYRVRNRPQWR